MVALALCCATVPAVCQKKPKDQLVKPMAGPRATPLRVTILYVSPDTASQKVDRVQQIHFGAAKFPNGQAQLEGNL